MRKTLLKTMSGTALAILLALTLFQVPVSAQDATEHQPQDAEETQSQESSKRSARARELEGTWISQVTVRNCQTGDPIRSVQSLTTYVRGGVVLENTSAVSSALRATGQGVWHHVRGRRYAATFMFFRFNPDGSFAGTQKITQHIRLSRDGEELNITATFEVLDANGTVITTGCVTAIATRFE